MLHAVPSLTVAGCSALKSFSLQGRCTKAQICVTKRALTAELGAWGDDGEVNCCEVGTT